MILPRQVLKHLVPYIDTGCSLTLRPENFEGKSIVRYILNHSEIIWTDMFPENAKPFEALPSHLEPVDGECSFYGTKVEEMGKEDLKKVIKFLSDEVDRYRKLLVTS